VFFVPQKSLTAPLRFCIIFGTTIKLKQRKFHSLKIFGIFLNHYCEKKKKKKKKSPIVIFSWCKTTQSIDVIREEVKYSWLNLLLYLPTIQQHNYNITFHTVYSYTDSDREKDFSFAWVKIMN